MDTAWVTARALEEAAKARLRSARQWNRDDSIPVADRLAVYRCDREMAKQFLRLIDAEKRVRILRRHVQYIRMGY